MIYKRPLRRTILHLEQRFLIDAVTFIRPNSFVFHSHSASQSGDYTCGYFVAQDNISLYGKVRISGSPVVTATECSK